MLVLAYVLTGWLANSVSVVPGYANAVWPPAGIALAGVMSRGPRAALAAGVGSALLNLWIGTGEFDLAFARALGVGVAIGIGAAAQACVGAGLCGRTLGPGNPLSRGENVVVLLLLGGPLASLVNATWSAAVLVAAGLVTLDKLAATWTTWWVGDSIGVMLVTPLLLAWTAEPRAFWRRRWRDVCVLLAVTLTTIAALFVVESRGAELRARTHDEREAHEAARAVVAALDRAKGAATTLSHVFSAIAHVGREEFHELVTPILETNPGMQALAWIEVVPGAELPRLEAEARAEGAGDFRVFELAPDARLRLATPRDRHAVVRYIEPATEENLSVLGFDMASEELRRETIEHAAATGAVLATPGVRLLQAPDLTGVVVFAPVYAQDAAPATPGARLASLRGVASAVLVVPALVEATLATLDSGPTAVRILDVTADPPLVLAGHALPGAPLWTETHDAGGRTWRIEAYAASTPDHLPANGILLASSLALAGLIAAAVLDLGARTVRVEMLVEERTAALARSNEALQRSNVELQRFAYVASHDMREPLRSVVVYGELLAADEAGRLSEDGRGHLSRVLGAAKRMQAMVRDILDLARLGDRVAPFRPFPLREAVDAALANLAVELEATAAHVVVDDPLPAVFADRAQVVQLLQNLLSNAVKFRAEGRPPSIRVSARREGDNCHVTVEDEGIGMEPRHLERIFEIFHRATADARYPGAGVGLATSRRIVERHGGRIWARSSPGKGSTFEFTLPAGELPDA